MTTSNAVNVPETNVLTTAENEVATLREHIEKGDLQVNDKAASGIDAYMHIADLERELDPDVVENIKNNINGTKAENEAMELKITDMLTAKAVGDEQGFTDIALVIAREFHLVRGYDVKEKFKAAALADKKTVEQFSATATLRDLQKCGSANNCLNFDRKKAHFKRAIAKISKKVAAEHGVEAKTLMLSVQDDNGSTALLPPVDRSSNKTNDEKMKAAIAECIKQFEKLEPSYHKELFTKLALAAKSDNVFAVMTAAATEAKAEHDEQQAKLAEAKKAEAEKRGDIMESLEGDEDKQAVVSAYRGAVADLCEKVEKKARKNAIKAAGDVVTHAATLVAKANLKPADCLDGDMTIRFDAAQKALQ